MSIMGSAAAWDGQEGQMQTGPVDDFQQYLDINAMGGLGDPLQFDFHDFPEFQHTANASMLQRSQPRAEHLDTPMSGTDMSSLVSAQPEHPLHHSAPMRPMAMTSAPAHAAINSMVTLPAAMVSLPPTSHAPPTPSEAINDIDAKIVFLQQQRMQQQQRQLEEQAAFFAAQRSRMVPPTPQSLDLQAGSRFYTQPDHTPQQGMYERYQRMSADQQDMAFTPLVSPAVTPLETQFSMDTQFAMPGAYFSPLASPSLHAQAEGSSVIFDHISRANNNDSSNSNSNNDNSPGDMDFETPTPTAPNPTAPSEASKKPRKNTGTKARGKTCVRQSPITKPQRKKTQTTPIINSQALSELAEALEHGQESSHQLLPPPAPHGPSSSPVGATDSENGSVSPETLSEMPPPPIPKPRSARPSPFIEPQNAAPRSAVASLQGQGKLSPATPASLMRLTSPNSSLAAVSGLTESIPHETIENFELPESVNFQQKPRAPPLVIQSPLASPSLEPNSAKTAPFQSLPSPNIAKPGAPASATQSPLFSGQVSSSAAGTPAPASATVARRTPQLGPRGSKKRSSVSSSHVSPALRPRISPNIKPLLPGGTSAEDAASKLLASKSNYQNILEGIHVPGVSYPTSLSTNLTSKRTSHKIAEQGRRNRINSALQEIATLLPASVPNAGDGDDGAGKGSDDGDGGDGDGGGKKGDKQGGAGGPNSKASTVEMAIEYIKLLKQEVAEATRRAEEAERKLLLQELERDKAEKKIGKEAEGNVDVAMETAKAENEADASAGS
ncbi:hypothetical protein RB595_009741 [Gaeumannomyces hyphopodioides]